MNEKVITIQKNKLNEFEDSSPTRQSPPKQCRKFTDLMNYEDWACPNITKWVMGHNGYPIPYIKGWLPCKEGDPYATDIKEIYRRYMMVYTSIMTSEHMMIRSFAPWLDLLQPIFTFEVETMATDGNILYINPYWVQENLKDDGDFMQIVIHELLHNILMHVDQIMVKPDYFRDREKANIAADYECNLIIKHSIDTEFQDLIDRIQGYCDDKYLNMTFEEIYEEIEGNDTKMGPPIFQPWDDGQYRKPLSQQDIEDMSNGGLGDDQLPPELQGARGNQADIYDERGDGIPIIRGGVINPRSEEGKYLREKSTDGNERTAAHAKDGDGISKSKEFTLGRDGEKLEENLYQWKAIHNPEGANDKSGRGYGPGHMIQTIKKLYDIVSRSWPRTLRRYLVNAYKGPERPAVRGYSVWRAAVVGDMPIKRYTRSTGYKSDKNLIIVMDTFGSVSDDQITEFYSEISNIVNSIKIDYVYIVHADYGVYYADKLKGTKAQVDFFKSKDLTAIGRGGTSYLKSFEWINNTLMTGEHTGKKVIPDAVIMFTDGDKSALNELKGYRTPSWTRKCIWFIANGGDFSFKVPTRLGKFVYSSFGKRPRTKMDELGF